MQQELVDLQDELLALRRCYGSNVSLTKSKGEGLDTPFPVTVTVKVHAPQSASSFDVDFLEAHIRLEKSILRIRQRCPPAVSDDWHQKESYSHKQVADEQQVVTPEQATQEQPIKIPEQFSENCNSVYLVTGRSSSKNENLGESEPLHVAVRSKGLPDCLRMRIARDLQEYWNSRVTDTKSGFFLDGVIMKLKSNFIDYLRCMPNCIEAYESVNDCGASVRRFAIVEPEPTFTSSTASLCESALSQMQIGAAENHEQFSSLKCPKSKDKSPDSPFDDLLATEVSMLKLRFGDSNFKVLEGDKPFDPSMAAFSVRILPSDPDWDSEELDFKGVLKIQQNGGLSVSLRLAASAPLPWNVRIHVERVLTREALRVSGRTNAGRALLKYVENHIAEDVQTGRTVNLETPVFCSEPTTLKEVEKTGGLPTSSCSSEVASEDVSDEQDAEEEFLHPTFHGGNDGPAPSSSLGVELSCLQLDNVDVVEGLQIVFQVACSRCYAPSSLSVISPAVCQADSSNRQVAQSNWMCSGICLNCHEDLSLSFNPKLIHEFSNILGWLIPVGCIPVDLHPSHFMLQCTCGSVASVKNVQVGKNCEKQCTRCRKTMSWIFKGVCFSSQKEPHDTVSEKKSRNNTSNSSALAANMPQRPLQVGEPLPNRGTCRHYHHSHRWLRFPCCGMRFPCDLCHEEFTDGHPMKWAVRMVCGFCSLEQRLGDRCTGCNKKLATTAANPLGRRTRFWEGGEGCRDKARLDRRDSHKYTNSKAKTKSNKSNRVGPKIRREKK